MITSTCQNSFDDNVKFENGISVYGNVYQHTHPLKFLRSFAYDWNIGVSANDFDWTGISWSPELSLFVAVAKSGTTNRVMTSPDGISWTARVAVAASEWRSVCWSSELSLFVAVSGSGTNRVMTSPDGITWTARTAAVNNYWRIVCWSPELSLFVTTSTTGSNNRVMTSPNGINWTSRTTNNNAWASVCWSPELSLFCAVSNTGTGNRVMTSSDGITWIIGSSSSDNDWHSVCWSPELTLFVAVSDSGTNRVMSSPDGVTWTSRVPASTNDWSTVCWCPELSLFVAVGITGTNNRIMTSPDGITWTSRTNAVDNNWYTIVWSPDLSMFVVLSTSGTGNRVMTSNSIRSLTYMNETTTPTAISGYGAVYPKNDNKIYFQDGAGIEHEMCTAGAYYGEMYIDNNSTTTTMETADTPIMLRHAIVGSVSNFTFNAGSTGGITAFSDGTGKVNVASSGHGLITDDEVSIRGTTNYNGIWTITRIDDNNFSIPDTWVANDGASDWDEGSHLIAGNGAAGKYTMVFNLSCSEAGGAGSDMIGKAYLNSTACEKCIAKRKIANNDYGNLPGTAIITIADNDKIYLTIQSSGTNNITCQYGNFNIHRL